MGSVQIGIGLALLAALMANLARSSSTAAASASRRPDPPAAPERPRACPLTLVRRRLGTCGGRLADPCRRALDGADLPRAGGARRRRRHPGGDVAAALRRTASSGASGWRCCSAAAGLALLAVTVPQFHGSHSQFALGPDPRLRGRAGAARGRPRPRPSLRAPRRPPRRSPGGPGGHPVRPRRGRDQGPDRRSTGSAVPMSPPWSASSSSAACSPSTRRSQPFSAAARSRRSG